MWGDEELYTLGEISDDDIVAVVVSYYEITGHVLLSVKSFGLRSLK